MVPDGNNSIRVEVNGVNFHCERVGNGEHPVVLLPGALGSSHTDFKHQLTGLNGSKYTLISFDPRGYGRSRPPDREWRPDHLQRDAEDAGAVMQKLGFSKYSVLGWSDGGITGLNLAAAFPEHVKKLVIWGANSYISDNDRKIYEDSDNWAEVMKSPYTEVYGEEYFNANVAKWLENAIDIHKAGGNCCLDALPKVQCPTLIINGHKDELVPQEHPKFLQKSIKNCRTVDWPEGTHQLHKYFPKEFNTAAEEFLDEL